MQWLVALETDNDPISTCRLMNIFRRKRVRIMTLALAAVPTGLSLMVVVETPEAEVEHIFNFLRRTEGVQHVTCYRHEHSADASYIFINADADSSSPTRILESFPESKLIFASQGKYLLEVPMESRSAVSCFGEPEFLPFARVKTTRSLSPPELVGAQAL